MKTQSYQETITGMEPETKYFFMIKAVSESRSLVTDEFVVSQTTGIQKVSNFDEIYHKPLAMMNFLSLKVESFAKTSNLKDFFYFYDILASF